MRIVVFGAGAVGSVIGGRVFQHADAHGHRVTLVARESHCDAIRANGLVINDPAGSVSLAVPVVEHLEQVPLVDDDVVVLAMKTQDTPAALEALSRHAPAGIGVACAQNGVENERLALRRFEHVYGICVMLPAEFMQPGVVDAAGAPHNAILDIGRIPGGTDARAEELARTFEASGLASRADPAIMRWKHTKLLSNLVNPVDALVSDRENAQPLIDAARAEGIACFRAAGIDWADDDEDRGRRAGVMAATPIAGKSRGGGSTWQSLARGAATTEVDWLNGEIVLLGRLHHVPTPVNEVLCAAIRRAALGGLGPHSMTAADLHP